jgi:hypothetical protein
MRDLITIGAAIVLLIGLDRFVNRMDLGKAMRAVDTRNRIVSIYAVQGSTWKYLSQAPGLQAISPTPQDQTRPVLRGSAFAAPFLCAGSPLTV